MRKKIQTLTMRENPKIRAMYRRTETSKPVAPPEVVLAVAGLLLLAEELMLATWVPLKAKKRNMVVPTNSPMVATKSRKSLCQCVIQVRMLWFAYGS